MVWPEVDSTNSRALSQAEEVDADGLVVMADMQTAGRGRLGRTWQSPRGAGLLCSVLLLADQSAATPAIGCWLTQASAVAVCEAVCASTAVTPAIKWPNDIRHEGLKLGGILIESRSLSSKRCAWVVGIGLNCLQHRGHFPPALRNTATSLEMIAPHAIDRIDVARSLLQRLDYWCAPPRWNEVHEVHQRWSSFAEPLGQRIRLRSEGSDFSGWTVETDPVGGLIVRLDGGSLRWFDPLLTSVL